MLLELRRVSRRFGGLAAVADVSMTVAEKTIHGLIGPNGAGKSTVFNLVSGVIPLSGGEILFAGDRITGLSPAEICRHGIARTFQTTTVFRDYTVLQNLLVAVQPEVDDRLAAALLRRRSYREKEAAARARVAELLASLHLDAVADRVAGGLPHREQKALGIGMAIVTGARLLLLDEPFAGLTVQETRELMHLLRAARGQGLTVLLVEHDMKAVMDLCDVITVLDHGTRIAEGPPSAIQANPAVIEAYLGAEA